MTYLEIVQAVCQRVGITTPTTLVGATDINILIMMDLVNEVYHGIAHGGEGDQTMFYQRNWWWLEKSTRITMLPTYKTGTVSGSAGSAVLTFVGTTLTTTGIRAGDWFQKIGDTNYFEITSVDTELQATLTTELPEAIAALSTYRIVRPYYLLPTDYGRLRAEILYPERGSTIDVAPWQEYQRRRANYGEMIQEGSPSFASVYGTTSGRRHMYFNRSPDKAFDIELPYHATVTELSADADTPLVPEKYHRIFVFGVAARFLLEVLDDTGGEVYEHRYRAVLASMVAEQDQGDAGDIQLSPDTDAYEAQINAVFGDGEGGIAARMAYKDNG